jgi:hypothetical protein
MTGVPEPAELRVAHISFPDVLKRLRAHCRVPDGVGDAGMTELWRTYTAKGIKTGYVFVRPAPRNGCYRHD